MEQELKEAVEYLKKCSRYASFENHEKPLSILMDLAESYLNIKDCQKKNIIIEKSKR